MQREIHFSIDSWADYVRGLGSEALRRRMADHLGDGCRRCTRAVAALERFAAVAAADAVVTPPRSDIRSAKALAELLRPDRSSLFDRVGLALRFDPAQASAAAGTRSEDESGAQWHFASAEYTVDLRLERRSSDCVAQLAGCCLHQPTEEAVANAPAFLVKGERVTGHGTTNEYGEFEMQVELAGPVELWLFDEPGPLAMRVELGGAASGASARDPGPA